MIYYNILQLRESLQITVYINALDRHDVGFSYYTIKSVYIWIGSFRKSKLFELFCDKMKKRLKRYYYIDIKTMMKITIAKNGPNFDILWKKNPLQMWTFGSSSIFFFLWSNNKQLRETQQTRNTNGFELSAYENLQESLKSKL